MEEVSCGSGLSIHFCEEQPLTRCFVYAFEHSSASFIVVYILGRAARYCVTHTLSPPVSFCLTGKDKDEGGRFKSNTSPGRHSSVWSSIILLRPPCASLELGCFHGDQEFDGQVCVWWLVRCESFHRLLSSKWDAKDLASLHSYILIYWVNTHAQWCIHCQPTVDIAQLHSHPTLSMSTFRCKRLHLIFFQQPNLQTHSTVHAGRNEFWALTCEIWL